MIGNGYLQKEILLKDRIMEKRKYHYEYAAYTDNLAYGRQLIVRDRNRSYVEHTAWNARKGCYVIEKVRVYENE